MTNERVNKALDASRHLLTHYLQVQQNGCKRLWCFCDPGRKWMADALVTAGQEMGLVAYQTVLPSGQYSEADLQPIAQLLPLLDEQDLVLSVFSGGIERQLPYFRIFPNLRSPANYRGFSGVIRQRYPDEMLLTHLMTDPAAVQTRVAYGQSFDGKTVRVTAPGGTDLTLQLNRGFSLPFLAATQSRHAFLPPAEYTLGVVPGSANGRIVADVTVGELAINSELVDLLGLVDEPVMLDVVDGYIVNVSGGEIARRFRKHLFSLDQSARLVVELGLGLSVGTPTGAIGADECLQGTCHFGIGDDFFYGRQNPAPIHHDSVLRDPTITII
ncbi:MAG: hypothetical protein ACM3ZQ_07620 [Bacillota bacterium]